jgi:hypothetical protein
MQIRSPSALLLLFFCGPVFANYYREDFPEFSGGTPFYEFRTSKENHRYFVVPSRPCTCLNPDPIIHCSKNLDQDMAEALADKHEREKIKCLANAGCSLNDEAIYAECPKKPKKTKK